MVTPIDIKGKTLGFIDSRIGGRKENQDSAGIKDTQLGYLVVVCDGMGGMQGGSTASQLAVKTILETVASADKQSNPSMTLIKAIRNANMAIIEDKVPPPLACRRLIVEFISYVMVRKSFEHSTIQWSLKW